MAIRPIILSICCVTACARETSDLPGLPNTPGDAGVADTAPDTGQTDVGPDDGGTVFARLLPGRAGRFILRVGQSADFSVPVRVVGRSLDLDRLDISFESIDGWALEAAPDRVRVEAGDRFQVVGTATPLEAKGLDGTLVVGHPDAENEVRIALVGTSPADPTELYDPEDIGFGAVEINTAPAGIKAYFSSPLDAVALPDGVAIAPLTEPLSDPWVEAWTFSFATTELGPVEGWVRTGGRRLRITGRGVTTALRAWPSVASLGDIAPGACVDPSFQVNNSGLGTVAAAGLRLAAEGPVTATWAAAPAAVDLGPIESEVRTAMVCATGRGPIAVVLMTPGGDELARLTGFGRGPSLATVSALTIRETVRGLPYAVTATVTNPGQQTLRIERVEAIDAIEGTVAVVGPNRAFDLEPGAQATITFDVTARGDGDATLRIHSNDPDRPIVDIPLTWRTGNLRACDIRLLTPALDFGDHLFLSRALPVSELALAVSQAGSIPCAFALTERLDPPFAWSGPSGEPYGIGRRLMRVAPNRPAILPVRVTQPNFGVDSGQIEVWASDSAPYVEVPITVNTTAGRLSLRTSGNPLCTDQWSPDGTRSLTLLAGVAITVDSVRIRPLAGSFTIEQPRWPQTLAPSGTATLTFALTDDEPGAYAAEVEVQYRVTGTSTRLTARRTMAANLGSQALESELFGQLGTPKVDLLFVIDGSSSMDDIESLLPNMQAFAQNAIAVNLDLNVAFATTDAWAPSPLVVPSGEPPMLALKTLEPAAAERGFMLRTTLTATASRASLEQPVDAARRALLDMRRQGLLRPDAILSVVVISDEDDASPGNQTDALQFFLDFKGFRNTNLFSISAISGAEDDPQQCEPPRTTEPAPRLVELARRSGGTWAQVCSRDWSRALEVYGHFGFKSRFFLTNQPQPDTIRVFIDGVEIPAESAGMSNWAYDFSTNSINFWPLATPEPGVEIEVRYLPECL